MKKFLIPFFLALCLVLSLSVTVSAAVPGGGGSSFDNVSYEQYKNFDDETKQEYFKYCVQKNNGTVNNNGLSINYKLGDKLSYDYCVRLYDSNGKIDPSIGISLEVLGIADFHFGNYNPNNDIRADDPLTWGGAPGLTDYIDYDAPSVNAADWNYGLPDGSSMRWTVSRGGFGNDGSLYEWKLGRYSSDGQFVGWVSGVSFQTIGDFIPADKFDFLIDPDSNIMTVTRPNLSWNGVQNKYIYLESKSTGNFALPSSNVTVDNVVSGTITNLNDMSDSDVQDYFDKVVNNYFYNYGDQTSIDMSSIESILKAIYQKLVGIYELLKTSFQNMLSKIVSLLEQIKDKLTGGSSSDTPDQSEEAINNSNIGSFTGLANKLLAKFGIDDLVFNFNAITTAVLGKTFIESASAEFLKFAPVDVGAFGAGTDSSLSPMYITLFDKQYDLMAFASSIPDGTMATIRSFIALIMWAGFFITLFRSFPSIIANVGGVIGATHDIDNARRNET